MDKYLLVLAPHIEDAGLLPKISAYELLRNILIERYLKNASLKNTLFSNLNPLFLFKPTRKNHFRCPNLWPLITN